MQITHNMQGKGKPYEKCDSNEIMFRLLLITSTTLIFGAIKAFNTRDLRLTIREEVVKELTPEIEPLYSPTTVT